MYKSEILANSLLQRMHQHRLRVNHMGLQKLMYFAHGWSMALHDSVLCTPPEAWKHGPIFPIVYQALQYTGTDWLESKNYIPTFSVDIDRLCPMTIADPKVGNFLDDVVNKYGKFDALQLATMVHDGNAWEKARASNTLSMDNVEIALDFRQLLERSNGNVGSRKPVLRLVESNTAFEDNPSV